jgi:hypothetical protein
MALTLFCKVSATELTHLANLPVELCMNAVRMQALHRASPPPQQSTMMVVKPEEDLLRA